jgi:hypothetical protein
VRSALRMRLRCARQFPQGPCRATRFRMRKLLSRMSSLATVAPSTNSAETGCAATNYIAIFFGAIAGFIITSVYYGVVFLDLWLQVR